MQTFFFGGMCSFVKKLTMNWFTKNNLILLRFHFSFFLLPVFLFALSQAETIEKWKAWALFVLLHFLVYPASNGYNSYMDRDETPIGGVRKPPKVSQELFYLTVLLDVSACIFSLIVGWPTLCCVLAYIFASRAYSYRGIRLKKYPLGGFLTVAFFQGAFTYFMTYVSVARGDAISTHCFAMVACSLLLGGIYPLTQIYQHEADLKDGVVTLSYKLGYLGTFVFCALSFGLSMACMFIHFRLKGDLGSFVLIQLFLFPVVMFFGYWFWRVWKDRKQANFDNTMLMNMLASLCLNACFLYLFIS